ncbi:MAG: reverse transcriptase/maturase family protein [Patescibacteria group bacterium]
MIHKYNNIISIENLCEAWGEFICGKKKKKDVANFSLNLSENIFLLHEELRTKTYLHGNYEAFSINDPKPRNIHKATVRDRLLHHAIYRILYPYFDSKFIHDSYSCRIEKGTHKAINRFRDFSRKVSKNNTKTCWVLKCDIKKFFANIDHKILKNTLSKCLFDSDILWLLSQVIDSFFTQKHIYAMADMCKVGLPLGNLTSQLLVNVYMNEFDQYIKRKLKVKYYIRYADDFVILQNDKIYLENFLPKISEFLEEKLKLKLHPDKVFIKTIASGIDFLGWVHFSDHRVLRTSTKRKMLRKLKNDPKEKSLKSYMGMLEHGDTEKLKGLVQPVLALFL